MQQQSVYITIPNGNGWIHKSIAVVLVKLQQDTRYKLRIDLPTHRPYVNNLHHCMNDFLDRGKEDFWLSIDDDNPPQRNPLDLVAYNLDIVGLPTPVWHSAVKGDRPYYLNALDYDAESDGWRPHPMPQNPEQHLQEVDCIGSGCFLVKREVMADMRHLQPFSRTWHENGTVKYGGDFSFCRRAKERGWRIFAHYGYLCDHYNELPLTETIDSFLQMKMTDG